MTPDPCLTPGCKKAALKRGLCPACHTAAQRIVWDMKSCWDKLVREGLCLPHDATCLEPGCNILARRRGLCMRHYNHAHNAVFQKKTTWRRLEAEGRAAPAVVVRPSDRFRRLALAKGIIRRL